MAAAPKIPTKLDGIDAEMAKVEARLAVLADARKKALDEQKDVGRPLLLAALARVKIGEVSRRDAKAIAKAIGELGPARAAEVLAAARN